jgi:adenosylcobinamide-phosphate synthase
MVIEKLIYGNEVYYLPLLLGFVLDLVLGDPRWLPHPIRLFGKMISLGESWLNRGRNIRGRGFLLVVILCCLVFFSLFLIELGLSGFKITYLIYSSIMVFYGLANRSLISEALKVEKGLQSEGLESARKHLSYIVGRDTSTLDSKQIRKAVLETLSENLNDGVIAPLFYFAIGGLPLMFNYKMVNTLDSMIGYKNKRYLQFGWFAARLDDVLNYFPARLTALLMSVCTFSWRGIKHIFIFGNKHTSPNAGFPEAALSGILNCRLGGPGTYGGLLVNKPYIGNYDRELSKKDVYFSGMINLLTSVSFLILILFLESLI